ncbi:hypothetical protein BDK51DRAFT_42489 [Blyttiomyces helicus]|uniref:DUF913 domain-containing protein n=1 Tax=Blyttiomyces helicus TaxID=388810 RepID=A0A4P9WEJ1_9FUNG|nr:hypothetical protein BDK51DRAFT_42489 [Blyttiomyces helicus]|eukprot:RKO89688.1 hypothetical protein BDK51DRAFT_42489 [Blyttiomyces helicus]
MRLLPSGANRPKRRHGGSLPHPPALLARGSFRLKRDGGVGAGGRMSRRFTSKTQQGNHFRFILMPEPHSDASVTENMDGTQNSEVTPRLREVPPVKGSRGWAVGIVAAVRGDGMVVVGICEPPDTPPPDSYFFDTSAVTSMDPSSSTMELTIGMFMSCSPKGKDVSEDIDAESDSTMEDGEVLARSRAVALGKRCLLDRHSDGLKFRTPPLIPPPPHSRESPKHRNHKYGGGIVGPWRSGRTEREPISEPRRARDGKQAVQAVQCVLRLLPFPPRLQATFLIAFQDANGRVFRHITGGLYLSPASSEQLAARGESTLPWGVLKSGKLPCLAAPEGVRGRKSAVINRQQQPEGIDGILPGPPGGRSFVSHRDVIRYSSSPSNGGASRGRPTAAPVEKALADSFHLQIGVLDRRLRSEENRINAEPCLSCAPLRHLPIYPAHRNTPWRLYRKPLAISGSSSRPVLHYSIRFYAWHARHMNAFMKHLVDGPRDVQYYMLAKTDVRPALKHATLLTDARIPIVSSLAGYIPQRSLCRLSHVLAVDNGAWPRTFHQSFDPSTIGDRPLAEMFKERERGSRMLHPVARPNCANPTANPLSPPPPPEHISHTRFSFPPQARKITIQRPQTDLYQQHNPPPSPTPKVQTDREDETRRGTPVDGTVRGADDGRGMRGCQVYTHTREESPPHFDTHEGGEDRLREDCGVCSGEFLEALKKNVPITDDVLSAIPEAFAVTFYNPTGMRYFNVSNPIGRFLSIFEVEENLHTMHVNVGAMMAIVDLIKRMAVIAENVVDAKTGKLDLRFRSPDAIIGMANVADANGKCPEVDVPAQDDREKEEEAEPRIMQQIGIIARASSLSSPLSWIVSRTPTPDITIYSPPHTTSTCSSKETHDIIIEIVKAIRIAASDVAATSGKQGQAAFVSECLDVPGGRRAKCEAGDRVSKPIHLRAN